MPRNYTRMAPKLMKDQLERYIPEPNSGCWLWMGSIRADGYGTVSVTTATERKQKLVHRESYKFYHGCPGDLDVLHRCDTPCCINPDHLFSGTHQDNMDDMNRKGRGRPPPSKGELNNRTHLTEKDVADIRRRYSCGETQTALGIEYKVYQQTISKIVHRKTW